MRENGFPPTVFSRIRVSENPFSRIFYAVATLITTVQLHSKEPERRFCAGSNPARRVSETCGGENL